PRIPAADRPAHAEIPNHALPTDPAGDLVVRQATGDPGRFAGPALSRDGHWLFAAVSTFTQSAAHYTNLRGPASPGRTPVAGVPRHRRPPPVGQAGRPRPPEALHRGPGLLSLQGRDEDPHVPGAPQRCQA